MQPKVRAKREALEDLWKQGLSGQALLRGHTRLVDEYLQECFQKVEALGAGESVSLVALGGYGRQELFPYSDIDIMILYRQEAGDGIGEVADAILYPLWDTGLEIGHGVRDVPEALALAGEDFLFRVALLDARLVAGSQLLFFELLSSYRRQFVDGCRLEFVETMEMFRGQRRERFGAHSYLLEPHIKEGKGGLRDIQAMLWTAKVVYGLEGINTIVGAGILREEEKQGFTASWEMLVRVRNRLHYISRRKNDQLYFEQQREIAEAFGYSERDGVLAVEMFMRDMYGHMQNIAVVTDFFFHHVADVLGVTRQGSPGAKMADKVVEKGVELRKGTVHLVASTDELRKKPHLLLRLYLASARIGTPVHHRSKKYVVEHLDLIDDKVRASARAANAFVAILLGGPGVAKVLGGMLETGLLSAYVPEFERIQTLAQYDIYHIYTVDRHSLQAVEELSEVVAAHPDLAELVQSPRVLFVAALLHDIGKGSGREHCEEGAGIARAVGRRMGFDEKEGDDLFFVVKNHLFMPKQATRRDLNDSQFLRKCADYIGSVDRLAMLYLLSVADAKATGPSAWSEWKGALLQEMFLNVRPYLEISPSVRAQAGFVESQVEQGVVWLRRQVADLLGGEKDLRVDVEALSDDYLLSFSPHEVVRHIHIHRDNYRLLRQKTLVFASEEQEQWTLLVLSSDQPGLLAKICGVMALNNLTVLNARIFTWNDGTVIDVLDVRPTDGVTFAEKDWQALNEELNLAVARRLGLGHRLFKKLASVEGNRRGPVVRHEPKVVVNNEVSAEYTVVEVFGNDYEGQLYRIAQTLADFGINIHKAFIATEVARLIDVFYVAGRTGGKIEDDALINEISEALLYVVGEETS